MKPMKNALSVLILTAATAHGETRVVPEHFLRRWDPVTVFFDTAVGPDTSCPEDQPDRFVRVTPAHPGAYHWIDSKTLQFRPAEPWPALARFEWRVGTRRPVPLTTLMAAATATLPSDGSEGLELVDSITMTFPEPMDPEALARMVTIELRELPGVGLERSRFLTRDDFEVKTVERKARADSATYVLALSSPIPSGTRAVVHLRLSLDDDRSESFTDIAFSTAQPFRTQEAGCQENAYPLTREGTRYTRDQAIECGTSDRAFVLRFSSPPRALGPVEARNLVRFTPPVENLSFSVQARTLEVAGSFDWDTLYRVNLAPIPLKDDKGRELEMKGPSELFLYFPRKESFLRLPASRGIAERLGPQRVPLEGRGDPRVDLRIHRIDPLDRSFWPFPAQPVTVDESERPPGPGEPVSNLAQRIQLLGSPPISELVSLPLRREGGSATFGLDLEPHLDRIAGADRPGTYLVGIRRIGSESFRQWMRLQVTDLSLSALEERSAVRFQVTSLSTGRPLPGATVRIEDLGSVDPVSLFEGSTDAEGALVWNVPGSANTYRSPDRIVVAKDGDVLVLDPDDAPDLYADNLWSESKSRWLQWAFDDLAGRTAKPETLGHVFTERPVYRPEDKVHVKGYLRQRFQGRLSSYVTPASIVVEGPGDVSWRYPVTATPEGSVYQEFKEDKLPTGVYRAHLMVGLETLASTSFLMESYRIPQFEVLLHAPDRAPLDREFEVELVANYYAGGRVAGRPVQWRVTQFPHSWTPGKREGFLYSSDGRFSKTTTFTTSAQVDKLDETDEGGSARIVLNPAIEPTLAPRAYVVEATVTGADDQTVTSTRRVVALPPFVLGLKVPRYIERARTIEGEILVAGPNDELIAGTTVTVRLLLRQWHSILRASDFSDGVARYTTDVVDEKVFETTVVSGSDPVPLAIPIDRSGVYVVELEAHDRLDRAQVVAVDLYAGGDDPVTWSKPVNEVFTVSTDKASYDPGETAHLFLESPFQTASALAVIEGPERNTYRWVPVEGGAATFDLPIENTYVPLIPVHFVLMRGRIPGTTPSLANGTDLGKPATMASTAWVAVNPVDNRVEATLTHPERALPGERIEVEIALRDPANRPLSGEVTLWLVDQAVLALGTEARLDPLPDFITDVSSFLSLRDTRNLAFGSLPFVENPGGGEGAEEAVPLLDRVTVRKNFEPVPYFNPRILVDSSGTARVEVALPDNLTNFKLRAKVASGPDRFGYTTSTVAVRLPVIVQPGLPRFARPGDRFTAAAIGRVVEGEGGPGMAEIDARGATVVGERRLDLDWVPNRAERIEFPVNVETPPFDEAGELTLRELTFRVGVERLSDSAKDAFQVSIPLVDDRKRVTLRSIETLTTGAPVLLPRVDEPYRPGTLRRRVLVSDQPALVTMAAGLDFLLDYPHGCTEQRISRARAQLALVKFRELLHLSESARDDQELERSVRETIEWIQSSVDAGGLTAYWPGGRGYVSLTAWVVQFLVEAQEAGFPVDRALREALERSLEQALRSDYSRFIDGESYAERTWALSALSAAGRANESYAAELARRTDTLNQESLSQVLVALHRGGETSGRTVEALVNEIWGGLVVRLYQGREVYGGLQSRASARNALILPSETRTLSEMTRALVRTDGDDPRIQLLVNALVTLGRGDGWGSTNANASALLALTDVVKPPFEGATRLRVRAELGSERVTMQTAPEAPVAFLSQANPAAGRFVLEAGGASPVVVRTETTYVPEADGSMTRPESHGFVVSRAYARLRPSDLSTGAPPERRSLEEPGTAIELSVADIIEDHAQVVNPTPRHYVAVVVPLAAGMEPLNPRLATSPPESRPSKSLTLPPTYVAFLDDHVAFYYDELPAGTYDFYFRTRATTPGSFVQPSAFAEMMYDSAVTGQSAGARVRIERTEQ